jgi:hypothetical protein
MTLVRIVPRLNEYPTGLVRDLRARGFTVETQYAPHPQASADLEIKLEQYPYEGICKELAEIVAGNDVVILAGAGSTEGKIRSIGMVLLTPESELFSAHKTAIPAQLNDLYLALLRGRAKPERLPALHLARETFRPCLVFLQKYGSAMGRAVRQAYIRVSSETALWIQSQQQWRENRPKSQKAAKPEPDLVPSMFSLSSTDTEANDATVPAPAQASAILPVSKPAVWYLRSWRPISAGAIAAAIACFLWLFDFSHPTASADQAGHPKPVVSETAQPSPVSHAEKSDKAAPPSAVAKARALTVASADNFQEVVVRHFTAPSTKAPKPDGAVKRVVVVD